jgi:hypothetical protein
MNRSERERKINIGKTYTKSVFLTIITTLLLIFISEKGRQTSKHCLT